MSLGGALEVRNVLYLSRSIMLFQQVLVRFVRSVLHCKNVTVSC